MANVAALNEAPRWPAGYEAVLREAGAQERTIPCYLTWVRRFFARFPGRSRRSLGRSEIESFLGEMWSMRLFGTGLDRSREWARVMCATS